MAQPYAYDVDATDADAGDTLTYSLTQAPSGMTINAATGLIAWTPSATQVPSASVAVRVVDGKGGTATQAFTIAVAQGNRPPAFTSTPKTAASEGRDYSYQATASDPDGDALTFSLTIAPAGMTIGATGLIAWKPASTQTGNSPVTVRVADAAGASATQAFTIVVTANTPPAIGSTPPTTGTEAAAYRYDVAATDADGDPLTYALLQSPAGMTIGPSGRIDWIPRADQTTANPVSVEVRDDRGGRTTQTFTVTVAATNHPPRIDSAPVTTAREQLPYSYQVHATDANGDSIAYALAAAPQGMTIDAASGLIAWTPPHSPPPSVHVAVTASDGAGGTDTQTFDITVTAAPKTNQAPRITSTPVTTAHTTEPYVYDVRADDPDAGDTLTFALVQPPTGMTIDAASGHVAWTPAAAQTGPFAVTVLVSDGTDAVAAGVRSHCHRSADDESAAVRACRRTVSRGSRSANRVLRQRLERSRRRSAVVLMELRGRQRCGNGRSAFAHLRRRRDRSSSPSRSATDTAARARDRPRPQSARRATVRRPRSR